MKKFIKKFAEKIVGTVGCFDRVLFKGHLPISSAGGMAAFLRANGVLFKEFRNYVQGPAQRLKEYARQWAEQKGRPYYYIQTFFGQLLEPQAAKSRVNTGSPLEKCQKGSATEYAFYSCDIGL